MLHRAATVALRAAAEQPRPTIRPPRFSSPFSTSSHIGMRHDRTPLRASLASCLSPPNTCAHATLYSSPSSVTRVAYLLHISKRTIITNHNFNTNKIVTKLEKSGFERGPSEAITKAMKVLLEQHTTKIRKNMLTSAELGNESYLFKAALTELRTELQILRKNDAAALAIKSEIISREIETLNQKLREDIGNLKNDIAIDMNSRKSAVREEQKALEIRIQSMSNHYMAQIGGMRTRMEAAKWEATRKGMMYIFIAAAFVMLASRVAMARKDASEPEDYIDPYVSHANAPVNGDGLIPDSFVVSHRS